jgi:protein gp37
MSDICHPNVKLPWVDQILETVDKANWHFYLFLTKRPNLILDKFYRGSTLGK